MKRSRLLRQIATLGRSSGTEWVMVRQGANHEIWRFGQRRVVIPRHSEINELTARAILRTVTEEVE